MNYISVIGLEVHAQLKTKTKIFCGCKNQFGQEPNTLVCPVCLGLPGSLPVMNKKVLEYAVKAGYACGCEIAESTKMDRKNYFYPDLPKAYQISQFDEPICSGGFIEIEVNGQKKKISLTRIHLEEDAGKLIHPEKGDSSYVDYNRTGVPLIEIVSEPEINSAEEAYQYLKVVKAILEYLDICDCNMQEGSLRCDANISIMPKDAKELGVKSEIKNMNSFRAVQKAIDYEIKRQIDVLESGDRVVQETRLWDADGEFTRSMRSKEGAHDYRYFPEPDILNINLADSFYTKELKESLPELPQARNKRFIEEYKLPEYDAGVLTADKALADYYEKAVSLYDNPKVISNWVMGEVLRLVKEMDVEIKDITVSPDDLVELIKKIDNNVINRRSAKEVLEQMFKNNKKADDIIKDQGLEQISDTGELELIIKEIVESNPNVIEEFKSGKDKALGFLIGQVMYKTKGKANPGIVRNMIIDSIK
jgi:aspartyl-tRNA(Asn)/glutamyl-tRNA(Gln) amidotransferase subunit B